MLEYENRFHQLKQKIDKVGDAILSLRQELGVLREFVERHRTDTRLCILAIERIEEKIDALRL